MNTQDGGLPISDVGGMERDGRYLRCTLVRPVYQWLKLALQTSSRQSAHVEGGYLDSA